MAVVFETTIGDVTIDLLLQERPRACMNFLKLCKMKYYNLNLIYSVEQNFIAQIGDPSGTGRGGESIYGAMYGDQARYFEGEKIPIVKHTTLGTVSMVSCGDNMYGSQFYITLGEHLDSLDGKHLVIGYVAEGMDLVNALNDTLTDESNRPYQDIMITHTVILNDPFPDPKGFQLPDRSPEPTDAMKDSHYLAPHEFITNDKDEEELQEEIATKEAEARATILEMVGDLPDADMAPPENVLFVCKLNPVTTSEDLEIIFSRFGKIKTCEVITDKQTEKSLQYAFIEFTDQKSCERAYFKMDNVLIDERRIHVDFSQSVSKIKWKGKGRGVEHFDEKGRKVEQRSGGRSMNVVPEKSLYKHTLKNHSNSSKHHEDRRQTSRSNYDHEKYDKRGVGDKYNYKKNYDGKDFYKEDRYRRRDTTFHNESRSRDYNKEYLKESDTHKRHKRSHSTSECSDESSGGSSDSSEEEHVSKKDKKLMKKLKKEIKKSKKLKKHKKKSKKKDKK